MTAGGVACQTERMVSRSWPAIVGLMALAAVTLAIASVVHFGLVIPLGATTIHDPFAGAAIPEAVIAAVVAIGVVGAALRRDAAWWLPLAATLFALLGVIVGMTFTVPAGRAGDIAYHGSLLAVLLAALVLQLATLRAPRPA